jgi:DNA-binding NtrC family response regulator
MSILITGETGVGKELVAKTIHEESRRSKRPFEAINCAAPADSLLESELFGHEKGAYTGADKTREGLFQRADGGTVFLDEVADMSLVMQAKLLRVLEEREVRPVGSDRAKRVDVRIVSATCKDLAQALNTGAFRGDLLNRLGMRVDVPPLRARLDDIPFLVDEILRKLSGTRPRIPEDALEKLKARPWPGNVRELRLMIEAAHFLGKDGELAIDDALQMVPALATVSPQPGNLTYDEVEAKFLKALKRDYYSHLWNECGGNISEISRRSGRSRSQVRKDMQMAGMREVDANGDSKKER